MSASIRHGRSRQSVSYRDELTDTGADPFDAITARADAVIDAQEAYAQDCREAADDARWARSVDYC